MSVLRPCFRFWFALLAGGWLMTAAAWADELKIKTQLVWGTDAAKPEGEKFSELDPKIREKFLRQLRWKNYFVVKEMESAVSAREARTLKLSKKCQIEVKEVAGGNLEVRVFTVGADGQPKAVDTRLQSIEKLRKGHVLVYGGDSKDNWDDAWLVVVTVAE